MNITPEEIARLRALEAKATPGPWQVDAEGHHDWWDVKGPSPRYERAFSDGTAAGEYSPDCDEETRDFIVATRNALLGLLDEIERLQDTPKLTASSKAFLDAVSIATSGRSYPNCEFAAKAASKITDTAHRRCAEAVIKLGRDWIDQSYEIERLRADLREAVDELEKLRRGNDG